VNIFCFKLFTLRDGKEILVKDTIKSEKVNDFFQGSGIGNKIYAMCVL
jgi:hypothetical protein